MTEFIDFNNTVGDFINELNEFLLDNNDIEADITLKTSFFTEPTPGLCNALVDTMGRQCTRKAKIEGRCGLHHGRHTKDDPDPTFFSEITTLFRDINIFHIKSTDNEYISIEQKDGETVYINKDDETFSDIGKYLGIFK